jgi:hypothetical protein
VQRQVSHWRVQGWLVPTGRPRRLGVRALEQIVLLTTTGPLMEGVSSQNGTPWVLGHRVDIKLRGAATVVLFPTSGYRNADTAERLQSDEQSKSVQVEVRLESLVAPHIEMAEQGGEQNLHFVA